MRNSKRKSRIVIDPNIRFGKPCIKGTRVAVTDILSLLTAGYSIPDISSQLPGITKRDVISAIEFASELSDQPTNVILRQ